MKNIIKLLALMLILVQSYTALAEKIKSVKISGNQRVEQLTVKEYLGMDIGSEFTLLLKNEAIKNLYSTSLFEDIGIGFDSGVLHVQVKETPFISKVVFNGNSKIKTDILANEIYTAPGESLKKAGLSADVEKIKEMYKRSGRFVAQVEAKIEKQDNNRVKVIFNIVEGPKTGIKAIHFVGNESYRASELKTIILTKESRFFRFLETNDTYDPERIEYDKHLLTEFYNSVGFAEFRVISVTADLLPTREGFILTYSIDEGNKYNFGKITLKNMLPSIKDSEISKFIENNRGKVFNLSDIRKIIEKITGYLAGKGYPQVDINPDLMPNHSDNTVDVIIVVDQAEKVFINKINIKGNLKTEDHVIRRQLKIAEGDVYNRGKIERGERNIRNLDYFGKMNLGLSPTKKADRYDINIDVEEKSTSSIGLDIGYNTAGGPFGRISFLERNLVGTGRYLSAGIQAGKKSLYYYGGLTDPNFMDRELSLGGNVFRSENGSGSGFGNGEQNYALTSTGGKITLGYDITDDLFHEIEYLIKNDMLKSSNKSASIFIQEQLGKYTTSSINHSLTYDQTDSRVIPKNGYLITATQEFAGIGGNTKYLKHELDGKYFKSFYDNKYTLKLSGAAGHITGIGGKKVRISDRFNIGDQTLRGFASGGVGPRDIATKEGLGGQKYYTISTELNFPLGLPEEFNVKGALFVDGGSVWDADSKTLAGFYNNKSLRSSVGFGFIWVTRIAPIRLDWGFPIKKQKYDEKQTFHIKFSTHF